MADIRLDYKCSAEQFAPRELVELAVNAEHEGFDGVAISDHFHPWSHSNGHAGFSLAWFAAVGERTSQITIGTSVLTPTFRHNPAVVAQAFATLGALYPARTWLGVGTGEALNEIATGYAGPARPQWPAFPERFERLQESIDLIRQLWTGAEVSYRGRYYSTHNARLYDLPAQSVPIYVAAGGPKVAEYAGAMGDGLICTSGKAPSLYTEKLIPAANRGSTKSGAQNHDRAIEIKISYDRNRSKALRDTLNWAALSLTPQQKLELGTPEAIEAAAAKLTPEDVAARWIVSSDPDEVAEQVAFYVNAGFRRLIFHSPAQDQRTFQRLFRDDLRPRLAAL